MQLLERLRPQQRHEVAGTVTPLAVPSVIPTAGRPGARLGQGMGRLGARAWGQYAPGMLIVLTLGLIGRLPGIWAAPLDAPGDQQAAMAAFVQQIGLGGGHTLVALPWIGPVPLDLTGGLPLYAWLTALAGSVLPGQIWPGRVVSLLAALAATVLLFAVVRRLAGNRPALYAALFFTLSPLGLYYGRTYLPDALNWLLSLAALGAALRWRDSCMAARPGQNGWFALAAALGALAVAAAPGNLGLLVPLLYIAWPRLAYHPDYDEQVVLNPYHGQVVVQAGRRQLIVYGLALLLPLLLWQVMVRIGNTVTPLDPSLGGGASATLGLLTQGSFYSTLLAAVFNNALTMVGFLLVLTGLSRRTRPPWPLVGYLWLLGALAELLLQAPRLTGDESALTPLVLPLALFAGLGAAWLATLPARVGAVLRGAESDDVVEETGVEFMAANTAAMVTARPARGAVRRQGWQAADPLGAQAAREVTWQRWRGGLTALGHTIIILGFGGMVLESLPHLLARYQPDATAITYADAGRRVAASGTPDRRMVVAGPGAAEIFYASGLTGWALPATDFQRARLDALHAAGAGLLASADQAWLGRQADYAGLLASFRVAVLDRSFIVFDLNTPPESTDRRYFLESGHTLRGGFRAFWEQNGGLAQFGYPLTEELQLPSPEDGVVRTTQVFERAVFELHDDVHQVLLAPLGRWLTKDKPPWPAVPAFASTPDHVYFPQTGHSLRGGFLEVWQKRGGLALFGYPISEEVREVNPADGKVHTVQYFERARFELHPEFPPGSPGYIQLGLVGKEWLEGKK